MPLIGYCIYCGAAIYEDSFGKKVYKGGDPDCLHRWEEDPAEYSKELANEILDQLHED